MTVPSTTIEVEALTGLAQSFSRERLSVLREAIGFGVGELAALIGASASAVSQLEHGSIRPRTETVLRLSLALGVPPAFFSGGSVPELPETKCHFRRLRSATSKERRLVVARARLIRHVIEHLEDLVEFPSEQLTRATGVARTLNEADDLALSLRRAWKLGLGPISDMVGLLEMQGVIPVELAGDSARLDAFSVWSLGRPLVFLTTEKNVASRRRFDAAHELGHLLAHVDTAIDGVEVEAAADRFASAFLLPEAPFRSECPNRLLWPELRRMKARWGVSLQALVRRAYDLGIYTEPTYRRAFVQLGQLGWRKQEPNEPVLERPTLVRNVFDQLSTVGISQSRVASDLAFGEKLFRELMGPTLRPG